MYPSLSCFIPLSPFSQVIPLDKLKTDYKSYDSKKQLSGYYDVYLADRRIYHLLPHHLGKSFFVKKRWVGCLPVLKREGVYLCSGSHFQWMFRSRTCRGRLRLPGTPPTSTLAWAPACESLSLSPPSHAPKPHPLRPQGSSDWPNKLPAATHR